MDFPRKKASFTLLAAAFLQREIRYSDKFS